MYQDGRGLTMHAQSINRQGDVYFGGRIHQLANLHDRISECST